MKRMLLGSLLIAVLAGLVALVRPLEAQIPGNGGAFVPNTIIRIAGVWLNNKLLWSNVSPTIVSGFGTSPSISASNGNATFRINVGTGQTASSGVVGLTTTPTAVGGWNCVASNLDASGMAATTKVTASTTTTITLTGYLDNGVAGAWKSGDTVLVSCAAY